MKQATRWWWLWATGHGGARRLQIDLKLTNSLSLQWNWRTQKHVVLVFWCWPWYRCKDEIPVIAEEMKESQALCVWIIWVCLIDRRGRERVFWVCLIERRERVDKWWVGGSGSRERVFYLLVKKGRENLPIKKKKKNIWGSIQIYIGEIIIVGIIIGEQHIYIYINCNFIPMHIYCIQTMNESWIHNFLTSKLYEKNFNLTWLHINKT